jgi:putative FmdB family regulatory protein
MPMYEYRCKQCANVIAIHHPMNDTTEHPCPECKTSMVKKFGAVPAAFKGEGFYTTDKFSDR